MLPAHRKVRTTLKEVDDDGTPLKRRFLCPKEARIIPAEEIVRGFEFDKGRYVVVTDQELEDLEPKKSREIDLRRFVDRGEISPILFEKAYYLAPAGDSTKAYRLLSEVLQKTQRVGIASFVMRDREYLIAITGEAGLLRAETLRFVDEIRTPGDVGLDAAPKADPSLSGRYERAIKALSKSHLDTKEMTDEYAERLAKLVERKRKRREDVVELKREEALLPFDEDDGAASEDLLETIKRSLRSGSSGAPESNGKAHAALSRDGGSVRKPSTKGSADKNKKHTTGSPRPKGKPKAADRRPRVTPARGLGRARSPSKRRK
jgi:DNA end-binding protein Ku